MMRGPLALSCARRLDELLVPPGSFTSDLFCHDIWLAEAEIAACTPRSNPTDPRPSRLRADALT